MIPAQNPSTGEGAPPRFRLLSALCYSAPLLVNGIVLPFFPVWLSAHQFNDHQIGTMGSAADGRALALLRLDRVSDALSRGEQLSASGVPIHLIKPDWARFAFPGETKAAK